MCDLERSGITRKPDNCTLTVARQFGLSAGMLELIAALSFV
jgi:hypothetical protein